MDKKNLLKEVEQKELDRLHGLNEKDLRAEMDEWFDEAISPSESRHELITDYMNDYMRYKADESEEELSEILNKK
jgi:hypothetical protein